MPMPSRAKANTVFFWASVVSTWALSPAACAAVKSPRRAELTLRSTSSCRDVLRSTATTRTSAFPYWLRPSTIAMRHCCTWNLGSRAPIRRVRERAHQPPHPHPGDLRELLGRLGALGGLVVGQPAPQLGQHLLRGAARGPDEEHVVETLLVAAVAVGQDGTGVVVGTLHRALLPPRRL